ncbi:hypothetical protein R1sor_003351 [Riccia sorocarpa]|uniref:Survival of motor neuron-related-splicing factor 30 n=1 Tax=Riccia sorocarpa TaxID=122646 RepID=A0ABD3H597_9MARC
MQSIAELEENLSTYEEQLQQVRELYAAEPENGEYEDMVKELEEVLEQTKELLGAAKQSGLEDPPSPVQTSDQSKPGKDPDGYKTHDVPGRLPVGTRVQAVWSEDGEWYNATIEAITANGYFVAYDEWGNKEEVDTGNIRVINSPEDNDQQSADDALLEAEKEAEATKLALKRKIAQAADIDVMPRDLPAKLRIHPEDPEDLKMIKRKKIHAFKSKQRLEQMELTQNKRQNAWQQFQTAKGKSKKQVGFFTGRKKESIFKSPDDPKGKVGVTGSGKGITEFHKREKHLHMRVGTEEGEDWQ